MTDNKIAEKNTAAESFRHENLRRRSRYTAVFVTLAIAFFIIIVVNINSGNVNIPISRIFEILFTKSGDAKEVDIIWRIRLPRILMAAMLGGALSLSGFLLQTFFENIMVKATTIFAPDEIPRTKGPAMGFSKKV